MSVFDIAGALREQDGNDVVVMRLDEEVNG